MLDSHSIKLIQKPLDWGAQILNAWKITANQVTLLGFVIGFLSLPFLAWQQYTLALICIVLNRICDGLDGALARIQGSTDAGGFLDISLDFLFYSLVPLGFVLANSEQNAVAGSVLIFAFVGTGSSFLAFAIMAVKHHITDPVYQNKSFYYMTGLTGGTETVICLVLMCLFPQYFVVIASVFAAMCFVTTFLRIYSGYHTLKSAD